jgi:excisionase family DNA binding protein
MKKTELAKKFGISRATLYRWEKEGIIDQKLSELQKEKELVGQQNDNEVLLREINEKLNMLQECYKMLQNVLSMLQDVSIMLQNVAMSHNVPNMSHNVPNMSHNVPNMSHNVTDSMLQDVAKASHNVTEEKSHKVAKMLQNVPEYFTAPELAKILGVTRRTLNDWILEGRIEAAKLQGKNLIPRDEGLKAIFKRIYDELNAVRRFGDSVPVPIFKDEVKKHVAISDEEIDKILLDLDSKEIIYLQTLDRPQDFEDSDRGVKFQGRILYFITWTKK